MGKHTPQCFTVSADFIDVCDTIFKHIRFFVGYSGWEEGQLRDEMNESAWIVSDMHSNYLFNAQPHTLWRTVLQHKGEAFSIIADMPDDNNVN